MGTPRGVRNVQRATPGKVTQISPGCSSQPWPVIIARFAGPGLDFSALHTRKLGFFPVIDDSWSMLTTKWVVGEYQTLDSD